mmetsp:Transcript_28907/g.73818  ORF Transcript_28907/g.73818 Transcript_28907/m.73818 type:complete len:275 (-) Transcript_28907:304-1128(-)
MQGRPKPPQPHLLPCHRSRPLSTTACPHPASLALLPLAARPCAHVRLGQVLRAQVLGLGDAHAALGPRRRVLLRAPRRAQPQPARGPVLAAKARRARRHGRQRPRVQVLAHAHLAPVLGRVRAGAQLGRRALLRQLGGGRGHLVRQRRARHRSGQRRLVQHVGVVHDVRPLARRLVVEALVARAQDGVVLRRPVQAARQRGRRRVLEPLHVVQRVRGGRRPGPAEPLALGLEAGRVEARVVSRPRLERFLLQRVCVVHPKGHALCMVVRKAWCR